MVRSRTSSDKDQIDRELEQVSTDSSVNAELDTLKAEMGKGESTETETETETAEAADGGGAEDSGGSSDGGDAGDTGKAGDVNDSEVEAELEELKDEEN